MPPVFLDYLSEVGGAPVERAPPNMNRMGRRAEFRRHGGPFSRNSKKEVARSRVLRARPAHYTGLIAHRSRSSYRRQAAILKRRSFQICHSHFLPDLD
jgi:hypothetical protein